MKAHLRLLAVTFALTTSPLFAQDGVWPTAGWSSGPPEEQGVSAAPLDALDERIRRGDFGYVNRLVVIRNGVMIQNERYEHNYREISRGRRSDIGCGFGCADANWDHQFNYLHPDWHPYHQGQDVHSLQSVTKSVSATLIGVAIHRGDMGGVHEPLLPMLDGYELSGVDPLLERATLEDLLTMRTGIEWHETDRPIGNTNTTILLERSDDWVQFTLDQPMDATPGEKWAYNSGGSQLMSAIIRNASGKTMDLYAEENLWGPLGIDAYHWKKTPAGLPDALGGLYLEAEQLAKIGYLYLSDGIWDGVRLLPEGWVEAATRRHVVQPGYGYQWWRPDPGGVEVWAGQGFGGQYLLVLPQYRIVAVINSWNLFGGSFPNPRDALVRALVEAIVEQ